MLIPSPEHDAEGKLCKPRSPEFYAAKWARVEDEADDGREYMDAGELGASSVADRVRPLPHLSRKSRIS